MSKGVVGKELLDDSVVAMEAVVASSKEGGVHGGSLPAKKNNTKLSVSINQAELNLSLVDFLNLFSDGYST